MNAQAMSATFLSLTSFPPLLPPLLTLNISYFFINLGNIIFKEYGLGLKDTVFQALVQQQDIVDLGDTVRITDQGVRRPENQPPDELFVRDRRLLP